MGHCPIPPVANPDENNCKLSVFNRVSLSFHNDLQKYKWRALTLWLTIDFRVKKKEMTNILVEKHRVSINKHELLKIGVLAEKTDISVGTIRYYESLGLLEPAQRSKSGYRYYTVEAIKRVQFIKKAQLLHFSLSDIQQILNIRSQGDPACPIVRNLLNRKIAELDEQLYQIHTLKTELEAYRDQWADRPLDDPCSQELCSMIEEVSDALLVE